MLYVFRYYYKNATRIYDLKNETWLLCDNNLYLAKRSVKKGILKKKILKHIKHFV